ncbi:serine hydrolase domain-containing protein [Asticcacaulis solisilvae]|uniref:serine hydrolase domain-containing protein n=1 Tax=Asticcacaulis solisilvae TaxID=1217274 RepID=UPI003FD6CB42
MRTLAISLTITLALASGGMPAIARTEPATVAAQPPAATLPPLSDFVGTYTYQGATIEIAAPDGLVAVLDGGKYPLRRKSADVFINGGGADVIFHRGPDGVVTAIEDPTGVNRRLSARISALTAAGFQPRPAGSPPYRYQAPRDLRDGIPVGDVARSDLGAEAANRLVAGVLDKTWPDVDSVLIFQGGKLVLEEYFYGYDRNTPHRMVSATKSVVGAVVGEAVANGAVTLDEPVLPKLGYATVANPDPRKSAITLRDLLTMQSGLDCDDHVAGSPGGESQLYNTHDWIRVLVDVKMVDTPGTVGRYCTGATFLAGRMVEKATGRTLPDYAQAHLFGPMGIRRADWTWNHDLTNADKTFGMMAMRPRDMLKFGMLYANGGRWGKTQVLPATWVKTSLSSLSTVENTAYGYYWWRMWLRVATPDGSHRVFMSAAQGNGGQKIYLVPELDLIAVFTGSRYNTGEAPQNKIMASVVLPALLQARGIKGDVGAPVH